MRLIQFNSSFTHLANNGANKTLCNRPIGEDYTPVQYSLREVVTVCDKCVAAEKLAKEVVG